MSKISIAEPKRAASQAEAGTPIVSVAHDPALTYPSGEEFYSPGRRFPEYAWKHSGSQTNAVYAAVRGCLAASGLDAAHAGAASWNPLGKYIRPGQRVFVLCNFVKHNITRDAAVMEAKCTHGSVVRAVLDYVLLALKGRGSVSFGNAPLQSCDWSKVIEETGARTVEAFYQKEQSPVPVRLVDLRQYVVQARPVGTMKVRFNGADEDFWIPVDFGANSLLEELYHPEAASPEFRVLDYDHRKTRQCHGKGRHVYLLSRHIVESDVVISIPKLKTHEKVGITCGIKGCVGAVAQKDCLAHHRLGSPSRGGDEYPDRWDFLRPLSLLHDAAYSRDGGLMRQVLQMLDSHLRRAGRRVTRSLGGAWPGNDTCWRMAVDLARLIQYVDKTGTLQPAAQREHLVVTDGVVAGEGNGPLSPMPVRLGYLSFADNVAWGDLIDCLAMGFEPERLPMIREALRLPSYPLVGSAAPEITLNGRQQGQAAVQSHFPRKFLPPREWRGFL